MNGKKYIDADALELAYRRIKDAESLGEHSGTYVYNRLFENCCRPRKHSRRAGRNGSERKRGSQPQRTQTRTAAS